MEKISEKKIKPLLTGEIGSELVVYPVIDSTNNAAKLLAKNGAPHGAVVIAEHQTAGKGRLGRSFYSPNATGIYMTIILRPTLPVEHSLLITSAAAVAAARAVEQITGVPAQIKWVNDLYFKGKKLCGILSEAAIAADGTLNYVVVGIGINCSTDSFPAELEDVATSIAAANGNDEIDCNGLIAAILNHFDKVYKQLETREFIAEYKLRSCVLGKTVRMIQGETSQEVIALDIDENAHLVVRTPEGERLVISSGEVSLKGDWR
ncbi:biotin--[acetyl-CoA-carboxylase] ligase [Oscillospiraceae bacterium PP1C4]